MEAPNQLEQYCISVLKEYENHKKGEIKEIFKMMTELAIPEKYHEAIKTSLSNRRFIKCYKYGERSPACSLQDPGRLYLAQIELGALENSPAPAPAVVTTTIFQNSTVGGDFQAGSFSSSKNAEAKSAAPIIKKKTDWIKLLKIIAGIIAVVFAILKGFGIV